MIPSLKQPALERIGMPQKCILILLDGLGDRSYQELDNKTPLQAAQTPTLDRLAAGGASGLYHASSLGRALPSEHAHFIMFGYDMADFPGRGALEALGAGIDILPTDVALLAHFAYVSEKDGILFLENGKPKASAREVADLASTIHVYGRENIDIAFHHIDGIRGLLTFKGDVSPYITDPDPFINGRPLASILPWQNHARDAAARRTARVLREYLIWAYERLTAHNINKKRTQNHLDPLNSVVTQRAGRLKQTDPFFSKFGLRGITLSSGMVYWGLGSYIGMDVEPVYDTGDPGTDMAERLDRAKVLLETHDYVHVHTKTPDEAAHTKDPKIKKSVIESLDEGIGRALATVINNPDILLVITADHSTPSSGPLIHSGESVPLIFFGQGVRQDTVQQFDEISAALGALGHVRGKEIMYLILNHLDRSKLSGIMDTPVDQPYWPGSYEPFRLTKIKTDDEDTS